MDEILESYEGELPEYAENWVRYFELFVRKITHLTTPDNLVTLKLETLEEVGFEIYYETKLRQMEEGEDGEMEEYEAYSVHPKGTSDLTPKDHTTMRNDELAEMLSMVFTEEVYDFQSWYILTYFNAELVAYITGLDVFRELMLESSLRIQIKKDEQETSRENKLRVKVNNFIMGSGDLLDRVNLLRMKLFGNVRILEDKTISSKKKNTAASFVQDVKKRRNDY